MRRIWQRLHPGESGAVLVTVGMSLIAFVGLAAIVIDGGLLFNEKRSAQNAADHAALAAAWADCNGRNPQEAANASVAKNGYSVGDLTLTTSPPSFTAQIDATVDMAFAKIIGFATAGVSTDATAECVGGSGSGGGGSVPVDTAIWTYGWFFNKGSGNWFDSVFSNGDGCNDGVNCDSNMYGSVPDGSIGSGNHFVNGNENQYGSVSCTLSGCIDGSGDFKNSPVTTESAPVVTEYPYPDNMTDFVDAYTDASDTIKYTWDGQCDGIYVLSEDVRVTDCAGNSRATATFSVITSGTFEIAVDELDMTPAIPGVLVASFADESMYDSGAGENSGWAIKIDANETGSNYGGLFYAPNGTIWPAGDGSTYQGSIVAESVYMKSNESGYYFDDTLLPSAPAPASLGEPILMQ